MGDNNSIPAPAKVDRLNSFHPDCDELKEKYDECFNVWFTEHYMNGHYNNEGCNKIFELYTDCVKVCLNKLMNYYFNELITINISNSVV